MDAAVQVTSSRLLFRSLEDVGEAAFLDALERGTAGTLDRRLRQERDQVGAAQQAKDLMTLLQHFGHAPGWWQLAYTPTEELVGFVIPCTNATVGYIGILPEQRGQGYIDALLARLTQTVATAGVSQLVADTDIANTPMANAFHRAGWRQRGRRQEYALHLSSERIANESA